MKNTKVVRTVFCMKCGMKIPDDARFCPQCGEKVTRSETSCTNKCIECGSVMEYIEAEAVMRCPYCGRTELLHEDNEIKIERIKSNAWKEVKYKEQEKEKEIEIKKMEEKSDKAEAVYSFIIFVICILFFVGCILFAYSLK